MEARFVDGVPEILRQQRRWLRWRLEPQPNGHLTKRPDRSTLDPSCWSTWEETWRVPRTKSAGIGFVFTGEVLTDLGRVIGFDLDACRDPENGRLADWVIPMLAEYSPSYTEVSPSGTGLHLLIVTRKPPTALPSKIKIPHAAMPNTDGKRPEIQVFGMGSALYMALTGQRI